MFVGVWGAAGGRKRIEFLLVAACHDFRPKTGVAASFVSLKTSASEPKSGSSLVLLKSRLNF